MEKEISFWKTQWFNILVGALNLIVASVFIIQALIIGDNVSGYFLAALWFVIAEVWFITALIDYNNLRIKKLQDRIDRLENCAITDIVEESPKYYVVKRRLGPDKED